MNQIFGMDKFSSITKYQPTQNAKKAEHTNTSSTIGNPKLSEKAASYYEELKAKYGDVDFVLVSNDQKENATELAANRQTNKSMTVLISEDEVEEMAANSTTRTENEKIIEDAKAKIPELFDKLKESGTTVKSFGIEFNDDGTASYFAVVDKSLAAQKDRLEQNKAEKDNKTDNKKISDKEERTNAINHKNGKKAEDLTTVKASSMEELIQKLTDSNSAFTTSNINNVMTQQEKMIGQHIDFRW